MNTQSSSAQDNSHKPKKTHKSEVLDKDLKKISRIAAVNISVRRTLISPGLAILFIAVAALFANSQTGNHANGIIIIIAAALGAYMAINIGANDVANNVGPAVGAKALTLGGALVIAVIFESSGALIAGGDVVSTISKGIIDPALVPDSTTFIWIMMAALLSAGLWLNLATFLGAPVSTTHSIVGGVMGAGIAAVGFSAVNWPTMSKIAASWIISPLLGGVIAAGFLAVLTAKIINKDNKIKAAQTWVPLLVAIMAAAFSSYLVMKGLKKIWQPGVTFVLGTGAFVFITTHALMRPVIRRQSIGLENRNQSLRILFKAPLICSAALLSFAHGANDVANAIGPLAAILYSVQSGDIATKVAIPLWVMLIGMGGISLGLFLYGPRLIRMVGEQITKLNTMRAFCVSLSAALTVIVASGLGLPVSSTHIAVGAVFGVGFYREFHSARNKRRRQEILAQDHPQHSAHGASKPRKLVRRKHFLTIILAWVITVPSAALLSALIYYGLILIP